MFEIAITDEQNPLHIDHTHWEDIARRILADAGIVDAEISIAVVDDPTIHQLNRTHLQHDYATDVLSFVLDRTADSLEGEVIVSYDTAKSRGSEFGLTAENELTLYVVHGLLHLVGFRDKSPHESALMREKEQHYMSFLGIDLIDGSSKT